MKPIQHKKKPFFFKPIEQEAQGSALQASHLKRVAPSRLAPFAGYLMPLWFSSIAAEHQAVRQTAGLFDCTHMGTLEFSGPEAVNFLNALTVNDVSRLEPGQAQYSAILDASGAVLDDIIVYQRSHDLYLVIVNAGNAAKIVCYLEQVLADEVLINADHPEQGIAAKPCFRSLMDGPDALVDIALQGPQSLPILQALLPDEAQALADLKSFRFIETRLNEALCIVARTGYTGAKLGFELIVPASQAAEIWELLLSQGEPLGLVPCGLGARDSLRIEAGLPLYGHELAGPFALSPIEAGYAWSVKLEKDFFVGQAAMQQRTQEPDGQVARLQLTGGKGVRPVRQDDPILDEQDHCIGWVLSCAGIGDRQIALAYLKSLLEEGTSIAVYYLARSAGQIKKGRIEQARLGDALEPDVTGTVVPRFARF